ncbi:MAG: anti-sigma factor [Chloroflexota bacterium]|nr:anti-sigma factor [Chloroflexota bacterium]
MSVHLEIDCQNFDELAPAYGLGAVEAHEIDAIEQHLDACTQPHDEARELLAVASLIPVALEPAAPSPALRGRLMATIFETPQEHRPNAVAPARRTAVIEPTTAPRRPWWQFGAMPSAVAAVGLAAAVGLGAWGITLNGQLSDRDAALRAVASADSAYVAQGDAGRGWVIQNDDEALFLADGLAELASGQLYELWLMDADGNAVAVGTLDETDGIAVVTLEQGLDDAATFAVTVETERVDQPTSEPVMVAALGV